MSIIVICGPTATGKSDLAVELALSLGGEIINADSMQLYQGMDIGTAKLSMTERRGVPHHLLDILTVDQDASVAQYQELARATVNQLQANARPAIIVGGTGLYIKSIFDEMNFPDTDPVVRARLEAEAEEYGAAQLFQRLQEVDPRAAEAIDSANTRRIIRALEVIELTGAPYSATLPTDKSELYPQAHHFGLAMPREQLAPRIEERVHRMFNSGLVDEVVALKEAGILNGATAQRAIGYRQSLQYLAGEISIAEAIESTIVATRQYVRRQETWFKRDQRIQWLAPNINRFEAISQAIGQI